MQSTATLNEVFDLAKKLSPRNKIRLIEHMAPEVHRDLLSSQSRPRKSLWGLWANLGRAPSAEEIDGSPRRMGEFPARGHLIVTLSPIRMRSSGICMPMVGCLPMHTQTASFTPTLPVATLITGDWHPG